MEGLRIYYWYDMNDLFSKNDRQIVVLKSPPSCRVSPCSPVVPLQNQSLLMLSCKRVEKGCFRRVLFPYQLPNRNGTSQPCYMSSSCCNPFTQVCSPQTGRCFRNHLFCSVFKETGMKWRGVNNSMWKGRWMF